MEGMLMSCSFDFADWIPVRRSIAPERLRAFPKGIGPRDPDVLQRMVAEPAQGMPGAGVVAPGPDEIDKTGQDRPEIERLRDAGMLGSGCVQLFGGHEGLTTKLQLS